MLLLLEKDRDAIVSFLETIIVPAQVGANVIQITTLLKSLPTETKQDAE